MKKIIAIVLTVMLLSMGLGAGIASAAPTNVDESMVTGAGTFVYADTGWGPDFSQTSDCVNGWGDDDWQLTLTSAKDVTVTVADCCIVGDYYGMYVDDTKIGMTPVVPYEGPTLSVGSATVSLLPGVYTITVRDQYFVDAAPYPSIMCPAGFDVSGALAPYTGPEAIDIKPWSDPNSINVNKKKGVTPVAILGSATFDVTTVDVTTLAFGPDGASPAHDLTDPATYADHLLVPVWDPLAIDPETGLPGMYVGGANNDPYTDLVSHYRTQETGLDPGDISASLTFEINGVPYTLSDSVRTVPPGH